MAEEKKFYEDSCTWIKEAITGEVIRIINPKTNKPYVGTFIVRNFDNSGFDVIFRTNENGELDGGNLPAIEGPKGHLEYFYKGRLHRDGGLPAVVGYGLSKGEIWIHGEYKGQYFANFF